MVKEKDELVVDGNNTIFGFMEGSSLWGDSERKVIDFDKVKTKEDIIKILKAMNITVWDDGSEQFDEIRHLLKDAN